MFKSALSTLLFSCLLGRLDCTDHKQETVKCGENATLQCSGSTGAAVVLLKWRKQSEQENTNKQRYVLFFRENRNYETHQLPSFKGRVQLRDPQMKNGDLSVIIKSVSMNDAGIYECYAGYGRQEPQVMSCTNLKVEESDHKLLTVKRGENAILQCSGSRGAVVMLKWRKPDLQSELENTNKQRYVLFIRENRTYENHQLPSFKGRVQLRDPQMKDGDLSVIIKNVSMNDAGIYECYAGYGTQEPQLMGSTNLMVEEPGPTGAQSGDGGAGQRGGLTEDGGQQSGSVGLIVGLSVSAVLVVAVVVGGGFMIYRKHRNQSNLDYQPPADQVL